MAYAIPDHFLQFPPTDHLQTTIYIKHIEIRGKIVQRFSYERLRTSLLSEYLIQTQGPQSIDRLMTISFKEGRKNNAAYETCEILNRGVEFCGEMFYYLGHSNSQLKDKTCYLIQSSVVQIHDFLAQFSDFSKIPKVAKRSKRIGLLFSGFNKSISLSIDEFEDIDDVEHDGYIFTDGCGLMSDELSKEIQKSHRLKHQPSVIQIRYQGYKGVLLHCPELRQVKVRFRKSMKKFSIPDIEIKQQCSTFGVVEFSKPFSNAYLNTQLAMVLADNQDPLGRSHLLQLQRDFYNMLKNLLHHREESAIHFLTITGRTEVLKRLRSQGIWHPKIQKELEKICKDELRKMLKEDDVFNDDEGSQEKRKSKLRVLVPRARVVFGVSDPYGELEYGEVFFRPSLPETEIASFYDARKVVVGRNPCYHPGDVRVLKLANNVEDKLRYAHLFDCLVFPVKGKRPHPDECSGGDLDGDKYFVSWDNRLVPGWDTNPFKYDEQPYFNFSLDNFLKENVWSPISSKLLSFGRAHATFIFGTEEEAIQREKMKQRKELQTYFSCYENDLVCRVNAIYMKYAARYGPSCAVCVDLNKYFSDAVDMNANKSEVEHELQKLERQFRDTERRERVLPSQYRQYASLLNPTTQQSREIERQRHQDNEQLQESRKAPFLKGDDVWTQMEEEAEKFVKEMRPYL